MIRPCVYIVTNRKHGTLYVGVTSALGHRIWQHKQGVFEGFSKLRKTTRLVWYETHETMETAIVREKRIKKWLRAWKIQLIETQNPEWDDLYEVLNR